MSKINDKEKVLTQYNDSKNDIIMSLNEPKTVKELTIITGLSAREIHRIIRGLIEQGRVRELSKSERKNLDWQPDTRAYSQEHWDMHRTDRRIPIYQISGTPEDVRNRINEYLMKTLSERTCSFVFDLINGRYKSLDPIYPLSTKLEKLFILFQKCSQYNITERIENSILDVCEDIRKAGQTLELDIPLHDSDIQSKLVLLYIQEALGKKPKDLDSTILSIKDLDAREVKNAVGTLHNLIVRGGFSDVRKHRKIVMDLVFELTEKGIAREILDELIDSLD